MRSPIISLSLVLTLLPLCRDVCLAQGNLPRIYHFQTVPVPENYNPGREAAVTDVNDSGQVCGEVGLLDDPEVEEEPYGTGYRWDSRSNSLILIKNLWQRGVEFPEPRVFDHPWNAVSQPQDINNQGNMAVLDWLDDDNQGFFWSDFDGDGVDDDEEAILLPTFDFRNDNWAQNGRTIVVGINDLNQVVGTSDVFDEDGGNGGQDAFIWEDANGNRVAEDEEMINLGVFGSDISSRGVGINNNGMIIAIGTRSSAGGLRGLTIEPDPVLGFVSPVFTDMGTLGKTRVVPQDLNENGVVVGEAQSSTDNQNHGFVWDSANGIRDLNGLPLQGFEAGWLISTARGINDHGIVVGNFVDNEDTSRPFVLDLNSLEFVPLDTLLDPPDNLDRFGAVKGINNLGQIVGIYFPTDTWIRSYLLTPIQDTDYDGLIDAWEQTHFGNLEAYSGRDNPDSDPFSLILEMAMDWSPINFDPHPDFQVFEQPQGDFVTLDYRQSTSAPNTTLVVEETLGLETWDNYEIDGVTRTLDIVDSDADGDGSSVKKKFQRKLNSEQDLFIRIAAHVHALAPLLIDDFSADQDPAFENPSSNPADTDSFLEDASILGGERDLEALAEPGSISAGVSGSTLNVNFGAETSGQVTFVWDGIDGTNANPLLIGDRERGDMLGPIDAEIAGFNAVRMVFSEASTEFPFSLTLETSAASSHNTDASFSTPFRVPQGGGEVIVPFSEVKFPIFSAPDLADIRSVRVNFRYLGTSNQQPNSFKLEKIEFDYIE